MTMVTEDFSDYFVSCDEKELQSISNEHFISLLDSTGIAESDCVEYCLLSIMSEYRHRNGKYGEQPIFRPIFEYSQNLLK